jgi:hypothetical protein
MGKLTALTAIFALLLVYVSLQIMSPVASALGFIIAMIGFVVVSVVATLFAVKMSRI